MRLPRPSKRDFTVSLCSRPPLQVLIGRAWRRQLHSSPSKAATPLSHPVAPGPPPSPPQPAASLNEERVARKRKQAELLERGRSLRASTPKPATSGTALQKRFWKDVTVNETPDGYTVYLDTRPVRTPTKGILTVPLDKPHLATAIALEWDLLISAQQALKRHYIPLTSLTSRALDIDAADKSEDRRTRDGIVDMVMGYLTTDTLLCWAPERNRHDLDRRPFEGGALNPSGRARHASLRQQQEATARHVITVLTEHVWPGAEIHPVLSEDSIIPKPQPEATTNLIRGWVSGLSAWDLAGMERACLATKSLCVAARLLVEWNGQHETSLWRQTRNDLDETDREGTKKFGIDDAAEACSLEVRWQTDMWGEVEDTHDVEREDVRMQLGSVILLVHGQLRQ